MPNETVSTAYPLPPHAISIAQFAECSSRAAAAATHGDNPVPLTNSMRCRWYRLDPIETVRANPSQEAMLAAGLGHVAVVYDAAMEGGKSVGRKMHVRTRNLGNDVRLDAARVALTGEAPDFVRLRTDLRRLTDDLRPLATVEKKNGAYDSDGTAQAFNLLSAESLSIHAAARQAEIQSRHPTRRGKQIVLHAQLGSLVKESVEYLQKMHKVYQNAQGANQLTVVGSLAELTYFTYRLTDWYRMGTGALATQCIRLAARREDQPDNRGARPRRGFDVVANAELRQVKHGAGAQYVDDITPWKAPEHMADNMDHIIDWFQTIIEDDASDDAVAAAWRNVVLFLDGSTTLAKAGFVTLDSEVGAHV